MTTSPGRRFDYVIVGGGLQGGLIALALLHRDPNVSLAVVEAGVVGGNHTWSFQRADIPPSLSEAFAPLVEWHWPDYEVRFPGGAITMPTTYASLSSEHFRKHLESQLQAAPRAELFHARASHLGASEVVLDDGVSLEAKLVLDARGPTSASQATSAFQKFVGIEFQLPKPGPWTRPLLMDFCVPQSHDLRFMYVLPFSPTRVLIEDTYFSATPGLNAEDSRALIHRFLAEHRVLGAEPLREEHGILAMPFVGGLESVLRSPLRVGYGGGWFHPATGYSFPVAARVAEAVAEGGIHTTLPLQRLAQELEPQIKFSHRLNRLLFKAVTVHERWHLMAQFFRLPAGTVQRFFGLRMTALDRARFFVRRPPRGLQWSQVLSAWVSP